MTALSALDRIIATLDADSSAETLREALTGLRDQVLSAQAMADCMAYVRDELVRAGIVSQDVPPMFIPEAVAERVATDAKDAERWRKFRVRYEWHRYGSEEDDQHAFIGVRMPYLDDFSCATMLDHHMDRMAQEPGR